MNIGIDIDDTITDTFDYLMPFVAEFFGADLRELERKCCSGLGGTLRFDGHVFREDADFQRAVCIFLIEFRIEAECAAVEQRENMAGFQTLFCDGFQPDGLPDSGRSSVKTAVGVKTRGLLPMRLKSASEIVADPQYEIIGFPGRDEFCQIEFK